ncbi:dethiobiotin synthase [Aneurinibacillus sp. Ricciae_BoGa-3]|uniref:dethiobiotin synthase n=1 Tax=Aneurinibacillus sp. Ricciae_BoGa-3 TaxID=3022697 RepID=UPI00233FE0D1|nr:dethiobiotin synthase [Aneurinibacillus sp. Ricciae_BoGa-3]WCK55276.1 dethiobiotin synthase [Aneurinibacillus sp. Ricciae_BoGa-3]
MSGFFVTATDTEVGKTMVAGGLAGVLRRRNHDMGVFKPIQSGHLSTNPEGDAARLKLLSGVEDQPELICPYSIEEPIAPLLALRRTGQRVYLRDLVDKYESIKEHHQMLIVEGAGGIAVPYTEDGFVVDLASLLKLPLIIVARPNLGTVNHTLLTIEYARQRGLTIAGVILSGVGKTEIGIPERTNADLITQYSGIPVLGSIPWLGEQPTRDEVLDSFEQNLDFDYIERNLTRSETSSLS